MRYLIPVRCFSKYSSLRLTYAVRVPLDIRAYAIAVRGQDGGSAQAERALSATFPVAERRVASPAIVVDRTGAILAWLLPDLISPELSVSPSPLARTNVLLMQCITEANYAADTGVEPGAREKWSEGRPLGMALSGAILPGPAGYRFACPRASKSFPRVA